MKVPFNIHPFISRASGSPDPSVQEEDLELASSIPAPQFFESWLDVVIQHAKWTPHSFSSSFFLWKNLDIGPEQAEHYWRQWVARGKQNNESLWLTATDEESQKRAWDVHLQKIEGGAKLSPQDFKTPLFTLANTPGLEDPQLNLKSFNVHEWIAAQLWEKLPPEIQVQQEWLEKSLELGWSRLVHAIFNHPEFKIESLPLKICKNILWNTPIDVFKSALSRGMDVHQCNELGQPLWFFARSIPKLEAMDQQQPIDIRTCDKEGLMCSALWRNSSTHLMNWFQSRLSYHQDFDKDWVKSEGKIAIEREIFELVGYRNQEQFSEVMKEYGDRKSWIKEVAFEGEEPKTLLMTFLSEPVNAEIFKKANVREFRKIIKTLGLKNQNVFEWSLLMWMSSLGLARDGSERAQKFFEMMTRKEEGVGKEAIERTMRWNQRKDALIFRWQEVGAEKAMSGADEERMLTTIEKWSRLCQKQWDRWLQKNAGKNSANFFETMNYGLVGQVWMGLSLMEGMLANQVKTNPALLEEVLKSNLKKLKVSQELFEKVLPSLKDKRVYEKGLNLVFSHAQKQIGLVSEASVNAKDWIPLIHRYRESSLEKEKEREKEFKECETKEAWDRLEKIMVLDWIIQCAMQGASRFAVRRKEHLSAPEMIVWLKKLDEKDPAWVDPIAEVLSTWVEHHLINQLSHYYGEGLINTQDAPIIKSFLQERHMKRIFMKEEENKEGSLDSEVTPRRRRL